MRSTLMHLLLSATLIFGSFVTAQEDNQTRNFAKQRATRISNTSYDLYFELEKGSKTYLGTTQIVFDLSDAKKPLAIDFTGESVTELEIDGKQVNDFSFSPKEGRIVLPADHLSEGQNRLTIHFVGIYSHQGQGFHRFVDPSDNLEYLYTHLEPNDAHRVFPCFDQPDIKATFSVRVLAPKDWVIVGNGRISAKKHEGDRTLTTLKKTLPFSSYIFQLSAGPYAGFFDKSFRYPLAVYCRQSLAKSLDHKRFLDATRKGFDFLEQYFDYPYPFDKYDQIFCPEFNIGAMENVAAVTWSESYLFRDKPTYAQLINRDETIYHEMAHMWFGDLVTMEWWNDLWLKESFATYMSYLAMEGIGVPDVWSFASESFDWAIWADQRANTHPILADVPNVRAAASIFDGITYGKGFAALRQLDYFLGGDVFRDGCRAYFKKHEWGVTTLYDFTGALESAAGRSLESWTQQWLGMRGFNHVRLHYRDEGGVMRDVWLEQRPSRFNDALREHALNLALFYASENGKTISRKASRVIYNGARTNLPELEGKPAPLFALPNVDDSDFVKVELDDYSLEWLRNSISAVTEPSVKKKLWRALWDMVDDGAFGPHEFLQMALVQLQQEEDGLVLETLTDNALTLVNRHAPDTQTRLLYGNKLWSLAHTRLLDGKGSDDANRSWFDMLLSTTAEEHQLDALEQLYQGQPKLAHMPMSHPLKWRVIKAIARTDYPRAQRLGESLAKEDVSADAKYNLLTLAAMEPSQEVKARYWQTLVTGKDYTLTEVFSLASGIFPRTQTDLAKPYIARYFDVLPQVYRDHEWAYVNRFANSLFPWRGGKEAVKAAHAFLESGDHAPTLSKLVLGLLDDLERRHRIDAQWSKQTLPN